MVQWVRVHPLKRRPSSTVIEPESPNPRRFSALLCGSLAKEQCSSAVPQPAHVRPPKLARHIEVFQ